MSDVKGRPGQARRERAEATRRKIVDCAYRLFCENGYPSTTMEAIGAAADVAVQTVYYVFRTKAALLREVVETAAAGEHDPPPVAQRTWMRQALTSPDGHRALALTIEHGVDIYARVAPLAATINTAAASDPDIDAYWRGVTDSRRAGMNRLIARLAGHGQLRPGLDPQRATDILVVLYSHETFLGLTRDAGWSVPEYKAWLYETLSRQLLEAKPQSAGATEDLSYHDLLRAH
ncbi:TetR/AcrR family transcriptional regulator [Nonomuraea polychroma]|uniref:TetR/AcrR family transcriptional regulator n=1 Tax=Nonomuraea polychroma TaxID=46176 RepID=UPI003D8EE93E